MTSGHCVRYGIEATWAYTSRSGGGDRCTVVTLRLLACTQMCCRLHRCPVSSLRRPSQIAKYGWPCSGPTLLPQHLSSQLSPDERHQLAGAVHTATTARRIRPPWAWRLPTPPLCAVATIQPKVTSRESCRCFSHEAPAGLCHHRRLLWCVSSVRTLTRLRPVVGLLGLTVLAALAPPAESWSNPYLLVQHQVYEEHQEVLAKDPSKRAAGEQRNDEDGLLDFIKDYLFKRGGAAKLDNRTGNGRAQFVGVDTGGARGSANGSAASGGAVDAEDSGHSDQRYTMHIIKFRLVNGSHPAIAAAARVTRAMAMRKKGDYAPQEPSHREQHHAKGSSGESHVGDRSDNATLFARQWSGRSSVAYRTAHPTHVTTARTDPPAPPPRSAAAVAAENCEQPKTTWKTTTTRRRTTTRTTTTTTKRPKTTPKPTTTTQRTTTCAPTTVAVVGCERPPPPPTTMPTTTSTTTPKPYLHGHPYVVIKLHEVKGTRRVPVDGISPQVYLRQLLANGTNPQRMKLTGNMSSCMPEYRFWMRGGSSEAADDGASGGASGSQLKGRKKQRQQHSRSRRVPAYASETAALKREVAGNLMPVLRTIRALDAIAQKAQLEVQQQEEEVQEQEPESKPQLQDSIELVALDTAGQIDQLLRRRDKSQVLRSPKKWTAEYADELNENQTEEGDLHQFSILLKMALNKLSFSPDAKTRTTTAKLRKAAIYTDTEWRV
ncbi:uncharacterized protein [Dermacentor albipictus]|uniref:uncharacterized protein n=1 Tax=Dermacentor albipictus TaxID=60249 RepID=UPI0031FD2345